MSMLNQSSLVVCLEASLESSLEKTASPQTCFQSEAMVLQASSHECKYFESAAFLESLHLCHRRGPGKNRVALSGW